MCGPDHSWRAIVASRKIARADPLSLLDDDDPLAGFGQPCRDHRASGVDAKHCGMQAVDDGRHLIETVAGRKAALRLLEYQQ